MEFKQIQKDYKTERYSLDFVWEGRKVNIIVSMFYHTYLEYWEANYYVIYGNNCCTQGKEIVSVGNRKSHREACVEKMIEIEKNPIKVIMDLDKFYKELILKEGGEDILEDCPDPRE